MVDEAALKQKLDHWDALQKNYWPQKDEAITSEIFPEFDELLREYINTTDEEQEKLRDLFKAHRGSRDMLFVYWNYQAEHIRSKDDEDRLRLGLAAISLEDFKFDWRDTLVGLSKLYVNAHNSGIDPDPIFKEIGNKSKRKVRRTGSTSNTISNFLETSMYKSIRKQLKK